MGIEILAHQGEEPEALKERRPILRAITGRDYDDAAMCM